MVTWAMQAEARQLKYPHVADFLEYVKFRWMVSFRKLEDPKARRPRPSPLCEVLSVELRRDYLAMQQHHC